MDVLNLLVLKYGFNTISLPSEKFASKPIQDYYIEYIFYLREVGCECVNLAQDRD
jgi:hypothetical protein